MAFDEAMAYAQATWSRFEADISNELLRAVCASFALVATADGRVDQREVDRFLKLLRDNLDALPGLDLSQVEERFLELTEAILSDPEGGRGHALAEVACLRGQADASELVSSAARVAVIADSRIDPSETKVLDEIRQALATD